MNVTDVFIVQATSEQFIFIFPGLFRGPKLEMFNYFSKIMTLLKSLQNVNIIPSHPVQISPL